MVFSSIIFLFYFLPFLLLIYYLTPEKFKNYILLFASILFYSWGAPRFVFVVLVSITIDFYLLYRLPDQTPGIKKLLLTLSLILNVGLLVYFKYVNFFIENVNQLLFAIGIEEINWIYIALPIGISFFTFQKISYSVDIYKGIKPPIQLIANYALYILMFPQLIAGPIVRYHEIADQLIDRRQHENLNNRITGFFRFSVGLAKKVLIANVLGEQVDLIFNLTGNDLNSSLAWLGIFAYSSQIYFDFSGYSDMAIGLGRMFGFHFPENFNNPYISKNITEFWRRWHMTLSAWMKEYLYIPLGGNRVKSKYRLYFNLWVVFLISGLWHGAAWTFIIWGIYHGFFLVLDRVFYKKVTDQISRYIIAPVNYLIILVGWVFFRSETLQSGFFYLKKMFVMDFQAVEFPDIKFVFILILALAFSFAGIFKNVENLQFKIYRINQKKKWLTAMYLVALLLFVVSAATLTATGFNPFIYFRF
jgi:alginate O-acetyltransferase complex protein AlgI